MTKKEKEYIQHVQVKYIGELAEMINRDMSEVQVREFTLAVAGYPEEVIQKCWKDILRSVRPGFIPAIKDVVMPLETEWHSYKIKEHEEIKGATGNYNEDEFGFFMSELMKSIALGSDDYLYNMRQAEIYRKLANMTKNNERKKIFKSNVHYFEELANRYPKPEPVVIPEVISGDESPI
tara:strand:+ start:334 stop:870 length:537 start_codon:yes stop_codon:yes gene_type:complete